MSEVVKVAVSLFSGGGFGDIGVEHGAGVPVIACCELLEERSSVLRDIFPHASVHQGDIWDCRHAIIASVRERIGQHARPWLLVMSPPCQGMSSNGAGRITASVQRGARPALDPRNRLAIPALDVIDALQPEWIVVENVKHMQRTCVLNEKNEMENLVDLLRRRLPQYDVQPKIIDAAMYGVPQRRERLITVCHRRRHDDDVDRRIFHAPASHGPTTSTPYVSFASATSHLGWLDAQSKQIDDVDSLHRVPRWTDDQYFAMRHTPEGGSAFDNKECISCHAEITDTRLVDCPHCHSALPRPVMRRRVWQCRLCDDRVDMRRTECSRGHARPNVPTIGYERRVVRAFKTSYRRMHAHRPAATLTTNSGVISSDVKGHPTQHRVLSLREVLIAASISSYPSCERPWEPHVELKLASLPERCLRHIAGESIPPLVMQHLVEHLDALERNAHADARNLSPNEEQTTNAARD